MMSVGNVAQNRSFDNLRYVSTYQPGDAVLPEISSSEETYSLSSPLSEYRLPDRPANPSTAAWIFLLNHLSTTSSLGLHRALCDLQSTFWQATLQYVTTSRPLQCFGLSLLQTYRSPKDRLCAIKSWASWGSCAPSPFATSRRHL